jgi:hypothetical protein
LALRIRRERTKERYLAVSEGGKTSEEGSGSSTRTAGSVSGLKETAKLLEKEVAKLASALEKAKTGAATSPNRSSELEFLRLQDALEKITAQIQNVEAAAKILLAKRAE